MTAKERFNNKYMPIPECGCWIWMGVNNGVYGKLKIKGKAIGAHRASWMLHYGPIPNKLWVLHKCDTPLCVNPDHLFLGTHKDNMKDAVIKKRFPSRTGESNPASKLTEKEVIEIKALLKAGVNQYVIADMYGIWQSNVHKINAGEIWGHIKI